MKKELFDIFDDSWTRIGTATRAETHRLGLRHRSFHCWLVRGSGEGALIRFQKRRESKDTYPGLYDITAAGHLSAGEDIRDAVRELEEELGISAAFEDLLPLGYSIERSEGIAGGVPFVDHERSEEFALRCSLPLLEHRLQHEEVAGIYEAPAEGLIGLFEGRLEALSVQGAEWPELAGSGADTALSETGLVPVTRKIRSEDFVPRPAGYYASLFRRLSELP
ncbi:MULTISPECIES: NUDIX hydrolase [Paenibacillus]|uniref:NUDIX hydrolase n=1 Tax=Paenibacillus TaxID=44249 RepID=UPI00061F3884|nr:MULTISPECIES: NUDIX domain-containing protein [Paenibacillus]KKC47991.1 hypothetical protein VE23_14140 [Paenibacillus sp. D9]